MNETIKVIKEHRAIRKYKDKPIEEDILKEIIDSGQCAPSSSFVQAYTIIRVKNPAVRERIMTLSGDQSYIKTCPEFLVFCADLNRLDLACEVQGVEMKDGYTETFILATVDTAIAAQNIMIAAEALGIGGVYIGGIRNHPSEICKLLDIPKNVYPVFGMCLGYPDENPEKKLRLPLEMVFKEERYSTEGDMERLRAYDEKISQYYAERTKGEREDSWSQLMARKMGKELRPHMKGFLKDQGFEMK